VRITTSVAREKKRLPDGKIHSAVLARVYRRTEKRKKSYKKNYGNVHRDLRTVSLPRVATRSGLDRFGTTRRRCQVRFRNNNTSDGHARLTRRVHGSQCSFESGNVN